MKDQRYLGWVAESAPFITFKRKEIKHQY
uniref:Uncharacterized protein n=1 Tax=Rhodnius prolixus TaxID=13249 RepID=T1HIF2_RHOPR